MRDSDASVGVRFLGPSGANTTSLKQQSSVEYLVTYGWAVVLLAIVVGVLVYFITVPRALPPNTCVVGISGSISCTDMAITTNTVTGQTIVTLYLNNENPYAVANVVAYVGIAGVNTSSYTCEPPQVPPGGVLICTIPLTQSVSASQLVSGKAFLQLTECGLAPNYTVTGSCSSAPRIIESGTFIGHVQNGNPHTTSTTTSTSSTSTSLSTISVASSTTTTIGTLTTAITNAATNIATNAATAVTNAATSVTNTATSQTNSATSQTNAATSQTNAATSQTNAATSQTNSATSQTNAATSQTNSATSSATNTATNAATSQTNSATSQTNSATSQTNAATNAATSSASNSATNAATSITNSATSITNSATSITNAATSQTNTATSQTNSATSQTNSATNTATNSATNSATSSASSVTNAATNSATNAVTNAATSVTNAATSATNAATSQTNTATSQTNSATSQTNTATSQTNSATSQTNAATSSATNTATNAATSQTNSATSQTNSATSQTNSATSQTNSATSQTNAATSATNAATSVTNTATSQTNTATSQTNAATSVTNTQTSATNQVTSATNAATSITNTATSVTAAPTTACNSCVSGSVNCGTACPYNNQCALPHGSGTFPGLGRECQTSANSIIFLQADFGGEDLPSSSSPVITINSRTLLVSDFNITSYSGSTCSASSPCAAISVPASASISYAWQLVSSSVSGRQYAWASTATPGSWGSACASGSTSYSGSFTSPAQGYTCHLEASYPEQDQLGVQCNAGVSETSPGCSTSTWEPYDSNVRLNISSVSDGYLFSGWSCTYPSGTGNSCAGGTGPGETNSTETVTMNSPMTETLDTVKASCVNQFMDSNNNHVDSALSVDSAGSGAGITYAYCIPSATKYYAIWAGGGDTGFYKVRVEDITTGAALASQASSSNECSTYIGYVSLTAGDLIELNLTPGSGGGTCSSTAGGGDAVLGLNTTFSNSTIPSCSGDTVSGGEPWQWGNTCTWNGGYIAVKGDTQGNAASITGGLYIFHGIETPTGAEGTTTSQCSLVELGSNTNLGAGLYNMYQTATGTGSGCGSTTLVTNAATSVTNKATSAASTTSLICYSGSSVYGNAMITLADGSTEPASSVRVGTAIMSYNQRTGQLQPSVVAAVYTLTADNKYTFNGDLQVDGNELMLINGAWARASTAKVGDTLFDPLTGRSVPITSLQVSGSGGEVYDFIGGPVNNYIADGYLIDLATTGTNLEGTQCSISGASQITLADGSTEPVSQLSPGTMVLGYDTSTRALVPTVVTYVAPLSVSTEYTINGNLVVDANEALFVNGTLALAGSVKVGDTLFDPLTGANVTVTSVAVQHGNFTVYEVVTSPTDDFVVGGYLIS